MDFGELVRSITGVEPYAYQRRLAEEGLPDLLDVPTGCGKTMAAVLPWLYRRRYHPDSDVRRATPRWLVVALPMRVLVEQTVDQVTRWIEGLPDGDDIAVYTVMGGEGRIQSEWRTRPADDAIFIGTIDMLLSRALNRGFGSSRFAWPIDFGLFNNGVQWVFDEVQLMGPALPTSRQLHGLREAIGVAAPSSSMWMSATVDRTQLETVDNPEISSTVTLTDSDRHGPLARRLDATKTVHEILPDPKKYISELAQGIIGVHRAGALTLAMVNTVERAGELVNAINKANKDLDVVLVHSRFRPPERADQLTMAIEPVDPTGPGRIVVSTQVLEAGVDISSAVMVTEAAPWPSIVQRSGRCNRDGLTSNAAMHWVVPPKAAPYQQVDIDACAEALRSLDGTSVTPVILTGFPVATTTPIHPVLRRRDLFDLFDTTADLSGTDIDVSRFIRDGDESDVAVAWWELGGERPESNRPLPRRDERCPVPIGQLTDKKFAMDDRLFWRYDHLAEEWVRCRKRELRPGMVLVADADEGCYSPTAGWSAKSKAPVDELPVRLDNVDLLTESDVPTGADPLSRNLGRWVPLIEHLADVGDEAAKVIEELELPGLEEPHREAAIIAGRFHDIGKVHPSFQGMLRECANTPSEQAGADAVTGPLAKSAGSGSARNPRRYFRHELASALALLDDSHDVLSDTGLPDLVVYLVAAHHGRVRLGIRSLPDEKPPDEFSASTPVALGVCDGEKLPAVDVPGGRLPETTLDLSFMNIGTGPNGRSWGARALSLRDQLGPFRLGALEAIVRVADWRVSAGYGIGAAT